MPLENLNFYFAPAGPKGDEGIGILTGDLVTTAQASNQSVPTSTVSYGNIEGLYFDTHRKTLIFKTQNNGYVELLGTLSNGTAVEFNPNSSSNYPNN